MPIYEYHCKKCESNFEIMQKFQDAPLKKCPNCGGRAQKLISNTSFILNGSGWYVTDYGNKRNKGKSEKRDGNIGDTSSKDKRETKLSKKDD